ncbi:unnamed protein product [Alopecurus aequalis]
MEQPRVRRAPTNLALMENPLLVGVIEDLPLLLDDIDLVQDRLDRAHAQINFNVVSLRELAIGLEEFHPSEELVEEVEDIIHMLLQQRRHLNMVVAVLIAVRAVAYARSRSRHVPGVLLAGASAVLVPGFRTFVRFSTLMLGFLFSSGRPRRGV